jgi:hypothetical protein
MIGNWNADVIEITKKLSFSDLVRLFESQLDDDERFEVVCEIIAGFDIKQIDKMKDWLSE